MCCEVPAKQSPCEAKHPSKPSLKPQRKVFWPSVDFTQPATQSGNQEATFRTYPLSHFPLFFCCEFPRTGMGVHITAMSFSRKETALRSFLGRRRASTRRMLKAPQLTCSLLMTSVSNYHVSTLDHPVLCSTISVVPQHVPQILLVLSLALQHQLFLLIAPPIRGPTCPYVPSIKSCHIVQPNSYTDISHTHTLQFCQSSVLGGAEEHHP